MDTYTNRVKRGVKFLDEVKPGWRDLVNPETLDISDGDFCVCGQVFAEEAAEQEKSGSNGFVYVLDEYGYDPEYMDCGWQVRRGFAFDGRMSYGVENERLVKAWKKELARV